MIPTIRSWKRGPVDTSKEHFELFIGYSADNLTLEKRSVAVIGLSDAGSVNVRFLIEESEANAPLIAKVEKEINFHLLQLNKADPWKYAQHHCSTASNAFGFIRWSFKKPTENPIRGWGKTDIGITDHTPLVHARMPR